MNAKAEANKFFALVTLDVGVALLTPGVLSTVLASFKLATSATGIGLAVFGVRVALGLTCRLIRHCLLTGPTQVSAAEERVFLATAAAVRRPSPRGALSKWRRAVQTLRLRFFFALLICSWNPPKTACTLATTRRVGH